MTGVVSDILKARAVPCTVSLILAVPSVSYMYIQYMYIINLL